MNVKEARSIMTSHLLPLIEEYGFKEKKGNSADFFVRKTPQGEDVH
jgi:hypothetical protein